MKKRRFVGPVIRKRCVLAEACQVAFVNSFLWNGKRRSELEKSREQ